MVDFMRLFLSQITLLFYYYYSEVALLISYASYMAVSGNLIEHEAGDVI